MGDEPFQPDVTSGADRLAAVKHEAGIASLDVAAPTSIVLDEWIRVQRVEEPRTVTNPGADRGRFLLSIDYWNGIAEGEKSAQRDLRYYGEYRMPWSRVPEGRWVAVSFETFFPPERDSADMIIPLGACDARCPS